MRAFKRQKCSRPSLRNGSACSFWPWSMQGPPGANLFVFRIPDDFTDESMKETFAPFGNLLDPLTLRVRVMATDTQTICHIVVQIICTAQSKTCSCLDTWGAWSWLVSDTIHY